MKYLSIVIVFIISVQMNAQKVYEKNYDSDGKMVSEGWMLEGKKQDFWKYYHSNGKLKSAGHFKNDKKDDFWKYFSENGKKTSEGHMENGKKTDWWVFYDGKNIKAKCQYENDQKQGICINYTNGSVSSATRFEQGKKTKTWTSLSEFRRDNNLKDL